MAGGLDAMTKYQFGKKKLGHWFCPTCGTSLVSAYVEPDSPYAGMIGLNVGARLETYSEMLAMVC